MGRRRRACGFRTLRHQDGHRDNKYYETRQHGHFRLSEGWTDGQRMKRNRAIFKYKYADGAYRDASSIDRAYRDVGRSIDYATTTVRSS
jgi:hypothetical protein